jgi:hypothetical protein
MVDGSNAITRLIKTVELDLKMFRAVISRQEVRNLNLALLLRLTRSGKTGPSGPTEPEPPPIAPYPKQ